MNWRTVRAIVRRDLTVLAGSKPVVVPIVAVPLLLFVGLPILFSIIPQAVNVPVGDLDALVAQVPDASLLPEDESAMLAVIMLVYVMAPLYLIVPIMVAAVIAADSIAGERERRTLEGLLLTPVTDRELFSAKILGAWIPAVTVGLIGAVVYGAVVNLVLAGQTETAPFPNLMWTLLAVWVGPTAAAAALGVVVIISARVQGFQEAYQLGGLVVLPVIVLLLAQVGGVVFLGPRLLLVVGGALLVVSGVVLRLGAASVARTRLGPNL